jgi:anti-sigma B factor antagonist
MNFEVKRVGDTTIFKINEKHLDSTISGMVKGEFTILLHADDVKKLIIDLSEVENCDSSGLSALLLAYRVLSVNQGQIRIASPSKSVSTLIHISQLDRVLPICNTVREAQQELENL